MSIKTSRVTGLAATLAAFGAMSLGTTSAWGAEELPLENWSLSGSLTIKKLNQTITLPAKSHFTGVGEITVEESERFSGPITGTTEVPPFEATLKILRVPAKIGLTFTEVGKVEGGLLSTTGCGPLPFCVLLKLPIKANIGFTTFSISGLTLPAKCQTSKPVEFPLASTLSLLELITVGAHFTGTTRFPTVKCGGLFGGAVGGVLTALFSGPGNPYSLIIREREE